MDNEIVVVVSAPVLRGAELSTLEYINFLKEDYRLKIIVDRKSTHLFIDRLKAMGVDVFVEDFSRLRRYSIISENIIGKYVSKRNTIIWFPHIGQPLPLFSDKFFQTHVIIGHVRDHTILCPIVFSRSITSKCKKCSYIDMLKCKNKFNYDRYSYGYISLIEYGLLASSSLVKTYSDYKAISYARNILKKFSGIIAISRFLKKLYLDLIEDLDDTMVTTIYNPITAPQEIINTSLRYSNIQHGKKHVLVYASGFDYTKGFHVLIEAMKLITEEYKELKLILLGEYNDRAIDIIRRKGVEKNIVITGYQPHKEVLKYFALSDMVIVPTIAPEPFGRIAAEANILGVPVVASNNGGLPEIVEDNITGLLVKPGDPIELGEGILKVFEQEFNRVLIHEVTWRKFNPSKIRDEFNNFINSLI